MFTGAPIERFGYLLPVCLLCLVRNHGRNCSPSECSVPWAASVSPCPQIPLPTSAPPPAPYMVRYVPFQDYPHRCFERDDRDFFSSLTFPGGTQDLDPVPVTVLSHIKILQARLQQYMNHNFQMFKLVLEKAEEPGARDWPQM